MQKANIILAIIEVEEMIINSVKLERLKIYVYPYHNGREKGWQLTNRDKAVTFSEYRNTDQIVVYCGSTTDFKDAIPSEEIYSAKTFFACNEYVKAAIFCLNFLMS